MTAGRRRLLMIAYHFPPLRGSSGIQRTLRFVQHLPRFGWDPLVLTASPRAYEETSDDQLPEVPAGTIVERAFALNTARDLALFGRYPRSLALPDRWATWRFRAVPAGMDMVRRHRPDAIWSTYPVATAHVIGAAIAAKSGLPWIADFRDPMAQDGYPEDERTWRAFKDIEETAFRRASAIVVTTPSAASMYRARYPNVPSDRTSVIENGFDEETFARAETTAPPMKRSARFVLLHSGVIYPEERDPRHLFAAIGILKRSGRLDATRFVLRLRASGHDAMLASFAAAEDIVDLVELAPAVPYATALQEMLTVDGLLILQASNCNEQIPAKLYEYLRSKRPILALTDPAGDTATTLQRAGISSIVGLDKTEGIALALTEFVRAVQNDALAPVAESAIAQHSREARAGELAELLGRVCSTPAFLRET